MTTTTKTDFDSIIAVEKKTRKDGMPAASVVTRFLRVNNTPDIKTLSSGNVVITFPSNLQTSEFSEGRLSYAMNGMVLPKTEFGTPIRVQIFVKPGKRFDRLSEELVKGAAIKVALGELRNKSYQKDGETVTYLEYTVDPYNLSGIQAPRDNSDSTAGTTPVIDESDLPF